MRSFCKPAVPPAISSGDGASSSGVGCGSAGLISNTFDIVGAALRGRISPRYQAATIRAISVLALSTVALPPVIAMMTTPSRVHQYAGPPLSSVVGLNQSLGSSLMAPPSEHHHRDRQ